MIDDAPNQIHTTNPHPPPKPNSGGGLVAKDALGNDVTVDGWLSTHLPGDRSLVQVRFVFAWFCFLV